MANIPGNGARKPVPILSVLRPKTAERFRRKLAREGECLVFTGTKNARGYGFVDVMICGARYPILTHRLAWALHHGSDPDPGLLILHRCNNPRCCNPEHLYQGTHQDNYDDSVRAGSVNHPGMLGVRGTDHPRSHPRAVRERALQMLRDDVKAGKGLNYLDVERRTGITRQTLRRWRAESAADQ